MQKEPSSCSLSLFSVLARNELSGCRCGCACACTRDFFAKAFWQRRRLVIWRSRGNWGRDMGEGAGLSAL